MVYLVVFAVVVFLACFTVVALLAWRTFKQVKTLGRAVADASARIAEAGAALEEIRPVNRG